VTENPDQAGPSWPALPYEEFRDTLDTLHAHTQILGKLAVALAPPEPQLQHAALRLTARGWETLPLPAPDGSGALVAVLDLRAHEALLEHNDGRTFRFPLLPDRSVAELTAEIVGGMGELGGPVHIDPTPQETTWDTPLDRDTAHRTYVPAQASAYFAGATAAALALNRLRAPFRGRSSPVNAWWGTFDVAVSLYSGRPVTPPSSGFIRRNSANAEQVEVGWWPGDARYPRSAFFAFALPGDGHAAAGDALARAELPAPGRWDERLGEFLLDWDDVRTSAGPQDMVLQFARSVIRHACAVCAWDPALAASADGAIPPVS
jgi:Family of unknown function (DUF5996)